MMLNQKQYMLLGGGLLGGWLVGWYFGKKQGAAHPAGAVGYTQPGRGPNGPFAVVGLAYANDGQVYMPLDSCLFGFDNNRNLTMSESDVTNFLRRAGISSYLHLPEIAPQHREVLHANARYYIQHGKFPVEDGGTWAGIEYVWPLSVTRGVVRPYMACGSLTDAPAIVARIEAYLAMRRNAAVQRTSTSRVGGYKAS